MLKPSFKPLKHTLLEQNITPVYLRNITGIVPSTYTKINKGEWVSLKVIADICDALNCRIEDVVEFVEVTEESEDGGNTTGDSLR